MPREQLVIHTADGECPTSVFTPAGIGPWPATIIYMDGLGIRPVLFDMGQRLADAGFVVLLPDLFYRAGPYEPLDVKAVFASGDVRKALGPLMTSTDNRRAALDTAALIEALEHERAQLTRTTGDDDLHRRRRSAPWPHGSHRSGR